MSETIRSTSASLVRDLFQLPDSCIASQRIAKAALTEHADLTAGDRRTLQNDVCSITVVAVVEPYSSGIPAFQGRTDELERDYAEIHFLDIAFSEDARQSSIQRFVEVLHRAIPNPAVVMAFTHKDILLSLAPKHVSAADSSKVVLDRITAISARKLFSEPGLLDLGAQRTPHLEGLYRSWESKILALLLADMWGVEPRQLLTGTSNSLSTLLEEQRLINEQIQTLQNKLRNEKQMPDRVALNTRIQALREQIQRAKDKFA